MLLGSWQLLIVYCICLLTTEIFYVCHLCYIIKTDKKMIENCLCLVQVQHHSDTVEGKRGSVSLLDYVLPDRIGSDDWME